MANLLRFLILVFLFFPALASAQVWTGTGPAPAGYIDLAGWIKNADGTSSRAFSDGNGTRSIPNNNTVSVTSNALVNTSKGQHLMEINKTAAVDVNRMGAAVAKFAKRVGPVGMAVGTASLICELSDICNIDGIWTVEGTDPLPGQPDVYPATDGKWSGWTQTNGQLNHYSSPQSGCADPQRLAQNIHPTATYERADYFNDTTYKCYGRYLNNVYYASNTSKGTGCADGYQLIGSDCIKSGVVVAHQATDTDWLNKQPLLNDPRFTPDLEAGKEEIPTGIPTLTPGQKKELGVESTPTKDPQGNITGREDTITELEPIDAGTADKPGLVIIKETKTTVKYDTNNTQISTTTSTSYSSPPPPDKPPTQFEIKFDGVDPVELPTHNVPNTFASTSWGDGTCPADIDLDLNLGHFVIPTTPICDTAEMLNPFVLALSALFSIYIVAGVRTSNT